ncbi:MAG: hypothetical protein ACI9ZH_001289 [Paracoccaceae bacterium]|jgi:hypothetical protein
MWLNIAILAAVAITAALLWSPMLLRSITWRAMITPLASIIGSGFLVLGPVLDAAYGVWAPLAMAGLCVGAWLFGAAIRYNIAAIGDDPRVPARLQAGFEQAASWALGFAYVISVAYYLNLFGAFAVNLTPLDSPVAGRAVTTGMFALIAAVGWTRGFKALERMEHVSVTVKLAIIAGLLVGLAGFFGGKVADGTLVFNPPEVTIWPAITLGFGLIVTVQGFETSRYLKASYDAATRIRSMKWAQWLSAAIYMTYIALIAYVFERGEIVLSETAIIDMMGAVAPVLPALLVAAALAAQFSAAVADTSGSGGLIAELTGRRVSARMAYLLLCAMGAALTWSANIFEIISYASRAFAVYYTLQAAIAAATAHQRGAWGRAMLFASLALLGLAIALLGAPVAA